MKFFTEYKSTILLLIATIIFGYILGLAISTVVDYRLRDAVINLPKPKNNIILNIDKENHKLLAKEKFVDYDSDLEEYTNSEKNRDKKSNLKKNKKSKTKKSKDVKSGKNTKKSDKKLEKHSDKLSDPENKKKSKRKKSKKKTDSKSKKTANKIRSNKKEDKMVNEKKEGFENYDAVEMSNNYSQINSDYKLKPNGKLFVNLTQKDSNLNKYSRMYNSNKKEPKVNFLEAANQEDTDQAYESIFKK